MYLTYRRLPNWATYTHARHTHRHIQDICFACGVCLVLFILASCHCLPNWDTHTHTLNAHTHTHTLMVQMKPHHTHRRRHLFVVFVSLTRLCHGKRGSPSRASFLPRLACCGLAASAMPQFTGAVANWRGTARMRGPRKSSLVSLLAATRACAHRC